MAKPPHLLSADCNRSWVIIATEKNGNMSQNPPGDDR